MEDYLSDDDDDFMDRLSNDENDDSDDSDFVSFKEDENLSEFGKVYTTKQIQNLKLLRNTIRENKALRKRLVLLESELERYQEFGGLLPLREKTLRSKTTLLYTPDKDDTENVKSVSDQSCQVNIEIQVIKKAPTPILLNTPVKERSLVKEKSSYFLKQPIDLHEQSTSPIQMENADEEEEIIQTEDQACQCDEDLRDKHKISELNVEIQVLKYEREKEESFLKNQIKEYSEKIMKLLNSIAGLESNLEITNEKLADSQKKNLLLSEENSIIPSLKKQAELLNAEQDQLIGNLKKSEHDLKETKEKLADYLKKDAENIKTIENQSITISTLESEIDRHIKEKHVICQQKIRDLTNECNDLIEKLNAYKSDNNRMIEEIIELNKHIERYKTDQKNFNFKEFVSLKRELNALKLEKERQFANTVTMPTANIQQQQQQSLPPIKQSKNLFNFFNSNNNNSNNTNNNN